MTRTPQDPADGPPSVRVALTGEPGPFSPPEGPGGSTPPPVVAPSLPRPEEALQSPQSGRGRRPVAGKSPAREADPAAVRRLPASPGRGQTPAVGAVVADTAPSAGSKTALSVGQMAIARAMKEDRGKGSLDYHVREILKELGLWGFHPLISIGSRKGWPDWTFIGKWIMYRELKSETGTLRPDQELVRDLIMAAGGDWALWRPSDYLSGRIARELTAISRLRVATA